LKTENRPLVAVALSLSSAALFLFAAALLSIPQPLSILMVSSVITIFLAVLLLEQPQHHVLHGALIMVSSSISFLTILSSAPWNRVIIWNGRIIQYQPELALHIFSGIGPMMLGITGGVLAILQKFFEFKIGETPRSFIKECIRCKKEIPIASEQCPYCGSMQNNQNKAC